MKRVAVLVSGGGTNLQALLESERRGENPDGKITLVIASKPGVYALERAANFGVESAVVSRKEYADSADFDAALLGVLQAHDIDVVVLAGFLSVLGEKVIAAYRNRILNVHPSLIPSFCGPGFYGLKVHEAALATRTYEDDAPNFTPRISGVVDMRRGGYKLSIVKSNEGNAASVQRQTFDYPQPVAGEGHFISTYVKNGAPIPSFAGEPLRVAIDTNDADQFAKQLWASLNDDNKVSLFVRSIALETGSYEDIILNKYTAVEG